MERQGKIVTYTTEELQRMPSQTDWVAVQALTDEEIEANIAADPDAPEATDAALAQAVLHLQVALEPDVWRWLAAQGKGYDAQINAIIRAHIAALEAR